MDNQTKQSGFTLVELIVVITMLVILAAVALPRWPGRSMNLRAQTQALAGDVRYTQNLAMTHGERYELVKTSATSYAIRSIGTTPIITVSVVNLGAGISFASFPNNLIAFDGTGVPYTTNTFPGTPLSQPLEIRLTSEGNSESIFVTPETGHVSL